MSQCAAILRVLRDGHRHSVAEIHALAGTSRLNSRVAGLRFQGYDIRCELVPAPISSERYGYRLVSSPTPSAMAGRVPETASVEPPGPQLELDWAAA